MSAIKRPVDRLLCIQSQLIPINTNTHQNITMNEEQKPLVHVCFEPKTGTRQYVIADPSTRDAVIIDPVLDFDPASSKITTTTADALLALVAKHNYTVRRLLETHVHADHLTASSYLQHQLVRQHHPRPDICIGKRITAIQARFAHRYGIDPSETRDAFDHLFDDDESFTLGALTARILHLPGHTPDHIGYLIGPNVFTGDSLFEPDVGSARCDFPGGDANALYRSITALLALPAHYRLYTGHDYPPPEREGGEGSLPHTTVAGQRERNKHVKEGTKEEKFVNWRRERDGELPEPRLIHQALQVNVRGGRLPAVGKDGYRFLMVPLKVAEPWVVEENGVEDSMRG